MLHVDTELQGAVDLALLHQVAPSDSGLFALRSRHFALLHIFCQVEFYVPQRDAVASAGASRIFLYDFEFGKALLEHSSLVNGEPDRERYLVVEDDLVVADRAAVGAATVFGRCGVRKVPFDKGCAGDEGDVVEVQDLHGVKHGHLRRGRVRAAYSQDELELWLGVCQLSRLAHSQACALLGGSWALV